MRGLTETLHPPAAATFVLPGMFPGSARFAYLAVTYKQTNKHTHFTQSRCFKLIKTVETTRSARQRHLSKPKQPTRSKGSHSSTKPVGGLHGDDSRGPAGVSGGRQAPAPGRCLQLEFFSLFEVFNGRKLFETRHQVLRSQTSSVSSYTMF